MNQTGVQSTGSRRQARRKRSFMPTCYPGVLEGAEPPVLRRAVGYSLALAASTFFWNTSSASALSEVKFQVLPPFCFTRRVFAR